MFSKFKDIVGKLVRKILKKETVEQRLKVEVAVSDDMSKAIDLWNSIYKNKSPWINKETQSMNLASSISREVARLVTIELESKILGNDYLNEQYQVLLRDIRNYTEYAVAKGGLVFKPNINKDNIDIELIQAERFFPTSYNSRGEITGAIFTEFKYEGKKVYTRLEYHNMTREGYYISNSAYVKEHYNQVLDTSSDLGISISLSEIPEWSELQEEVLIKNIKKPLFSYFKMPQTNSVDTGSPLGVSIFANSVDIIKEADKQYSRILWEYEGSELAVDASSDCFKNNLDGTPQLPQGKERLFRGLDFDVSKGNKALETFSPEIRDASLFNGLNQLLRRIEFNCGLAYGTLSDVNETDKTATEVKASKQRSYSTVKDMQNSLKASLEHLVYVMDIYAKLYGLPSSKYEMTFNFDDSLVLDKDAELASMLGDVSAGILRAEIYLAKKYGCSEEEALKMMPSYGDITNSPYKGTEE